MPDEPPPGPARGQAGAELGEEVPPRPFDDVIDRWGPRDMPAGAAGGEDHVYRIGGEGHLYRIGGEGHGKRLSTIGEKMGDEIADNASGAETERGGKNMNHRKQLNAERRMGRTNPKEEGGLGGEGVVGSVSHASQVPPAVQQQQRQQRHLAFPGSPGREPPSGKSPVGIQGSNK